MGNGDKSRSWKQAALWAVFGALVSHGAHMLHSSEGGEKSSSVYKNSLPVASWTERASAGWQLGLNVASADKLNELSWSCGWVNQDGSALSTQGSWSTSPLVPLAWEKMEWLSNGSSRGVGSDWVASCRSTVSSFPDEWAGREKNLPSLKSVWNIQSWGYCA